MRLGLRGLKPGFGFLVEYRPAPNIESDRHAVAARDPDLPILRPPPRARGTRQQVPVPPILLTSSRLGSPAATVVRQHCNSTGLMLPGQIGSRQVKAAASMRIGRKHGGRRTIESPHVPLSWPARKTGRGISDQEDRLPVDRKSPSIILPGSKSLPAASFWSRGTRARSKPRWHSPDFGGNRRRGRSLTPPPTARLGALGGRPRATGFGFSVRMQHLQSTETVCAKMARPTSECRRFRETRVLDPVPISGTTGTSSGWYLNGPAFADTILAADREPNTALKESATAQQARAFRAGFPVSLDGRARRR